MQANNLLVTGDSRFLNEIKGKIDWTNILSKPTIPAAVAVKGNAETSYRTGNVNITPANIGLGNVGNFKAVSTVASQGLTSTEQSNARANIGAGTSNLTIGTSATTAMAGNTNVNNVTQTATTVTSDTKYELLFSNTADNTNRTEGTRKSSLLTFSPKPAGVKLTMNYDGSRPNNYGDITIKGNNDSDSCITLHSSSAGMSYMWIKHPTPGVGIFLEGGSDSSSEYSKGMISADDFVVSGHDWEGNNITWDGTNTSLKTAITNKLDKSGGAMTGNITYSLHEEISGGTSTCDRTTKVNERGLQYTSTQNSSINPTSNVYIGSRENDLDGMSSIVVCTGTDSTWQSGSEYRTHITPSGIQVSYGNKTQSSSVSVQSGDIINNSKWDGTNTSLKTALAGKMTNQVQSAQVGISCLKSNMMMYKCGRIVYFSIIADFNSTGLPSRVTTNVGSITAADWKPIALSDSGLAGFNNQISMSIKTDGTITMYNYTTAAVATGWFRWSGCYITAS